MKLIYYKQPKNPQYPNIKCMCVFLINILKILDSIINNVCVYTIYFESSKFLVQKNVYS